MMMTATSDSQTMRRQRFFLFLIALSIAIFASSTFAQNTNSSATSGTIMRLEGAVTPASAGYLIRTIEEAGNANTDLIIMEIDTPGGLVDSMQSIIKSIFASDVPVVTYVSPQGARSASAGLYIMYAAHISAMAPATNTGSATPITLGGGGNDKPIFEDPPFETAPDPDTEATGEEEPETSSQEGEAAPTESDDKAANQPAEDKPADISNDASLRGKIIEDSVAYIRAIAQERGRNADWAEKAVRPPSANITSNEALEMNVIDIVAEDLDDLLAQIDGRVVKTAAGDITISTDNMALTRVEPTLLERVLAIFANPNVAAILFSLGTLGLTVELWNPGSVFPGTFGAICLALAFYSSQILPVDMLFVVIAAVGAILIAIEAFTPSFGLIGLFGVIIFGTGLYYVFPGEFQLSKSFIGIMMIIGAGFLSLILFALIGSRSGGPLIGAEAIRKRQGIVDEWDPATGTGHVIVEGERWQARSKQPLKPGANVIVTEVDGLVLVVKSATAGATMVQRMITRHSTSTTTPDAPA